MIALETSSLWRFAEQAKRANCSRCGFCLAVCPTYRLTGLEVQSPRGRIALIDAVARGDLEAGEGFRQHMYHCLFCQACETACPSGVKIGKAVVTARAALEKTSKPSPAKQAALRWLLPHPGRLALAAWLLRLYQRLGLGRLLRPLLPAKLRLLEELLPPLSPRPLRDELPEVIPPRGPARRRVGFFLGCFMSLAYADASRATLEVLAENGCEVIVPRAQRCCGAPHLAEGDRESLLELARRNVDAFEGAGVDAILADCAACSATLKDYAELLASDPGYASKAEAFSGKARDITEFLAELPLRQPQGCLDLTATYHAPCHLAHAQGITSAPGLLLRAIPGLELRELREADSCCGSAGGYLVTHPDQSARILERKMGNIDATGAKVVATANPGCMLHLRLGAQRRGNGARVVHVTQLLADSYRAERDAR